jgi:hypothetical protein
LGLYFDLKRAKTGRSAIGTLTARSERLLSAYLNSLGVTLAPDAPIFRNRSGKPYSKDTLGDDFRDIRAKVFGVHERRTLSDFRRSGAIEATAGGVTGPQLSNKMANDISTSNELFQAYNPVNITSVRAADAARRIGRTKRRENI